MMRPDGDIPLSQSPWLLLASQSPRRRDLLEQYGFDHLAIDPGVDDGLLASGEVEPEQWVASLAYFKAAAGLEQIREAGGPMPPVVIGADTICVKDGELIGQPRDAADAARIIRLFEDAEHEVLTGVAIVSSVTGRRALFVDKAVVRVGEIGAERIDEYVESGQWQGKAGAYNLSERLEAGWPIEYDGDPTSIMGLPMEALKNHLGRFQALEDAM